MMNPRDQRPSSAPRRNLFGAPGLALAAGIVLGGCGGEREPSAKAEIAESPADWKRPQTCLECHAEAFQAWSGSHHFHAQRAGDPEIDGEILSERAPAHPVAGVIGYEPLRQVLVPFPRGRLQAHELAWDPQAEEWFDVFGEEERAPGDWGHWTQQGMNWNANCAYCHVTEYAKNYDLRSDSYRSEYADVGVSCIQCHAGMERHVADARSGALAALSPEARASASVSMDTCASCHSRREELAAEGLRPGERYDDHYRLTLPDAPGAYFHNGLAREENFEYGSLMLSAMGHAGVSCMDCHEPHGGGLTLPAQNNALCLQCHAAGDRGAPLIDPAAHSQHPVGSDGARCIECHMPERLYMERDARRDHGFTIPDPRSTILRGEPNACVQCHSDQSPEWTAEQFDRLFPETDRLQRQRRRGDALAAGAPSELLALLYETENPFWRATLLRLLTPHANEPEVAQAAQRSLASPAAIERDAALAVLAGRPDAATLAAPALDDPARLVRIRAVEIAMPQLDLSHQAFAEWRGYLDANADRPGGALRRAELAIVDGDADLARDLALRAVSFDRSNPRLRYDAAILLARVDRADAALALLAEARRLDPSLAPIPYAQGLLHAEKGDPRQAARHLEEALALDPQVARWWYNLAVAYLQTGDKPKAAASLGRALALEPENRAFREFEERYLAP